MSDIEREIDSRSGNDSEQIAGLLVQVFPNSKEEKLGSYGGSNKFLHFEDGRLTGILVLNPADDLLRNALVENAGGLDALSLIGGNILVINGVAVDPDFRGEGIYSSLVGEMLERYPNTNIVLGSTPNPVAALARAKTFSEIDGEEWVTMWGGLQIPKSNLNILEIENLQGLANEYLKYIGLGTYPAKFKIINYSAGYIYSMFNNPYDFENSQGSFPKNVSTVLRSLSHMQMLKANIVKPEDFDEDRSDRFVPQAVLLSIRKSLLVSGI